MPGRIKTDDLPIRQTPRGLLTQAREFQKAAVLIVDAAGVDDVTGGLRDRGYHHPFYYLCGHSLELSMKAALLAAGASHADLKKLGHDLEKCFGLLLEELPGSISFDDQYQETIRVLNASYKEKEFEYRVTGAKTWPTVHPLLHVVEEQCIVADEIVSQR